MLSNDLREVEISDVSITNVGFAIFLKPVDGSTEKVVPIFIGPLETYSISSALEGSPPPRPNTHDLIVNMLEELEAKIRYVVINDVIGSIYYARIIIESEGETAEIDARPSDSVALAVRLKCPIYIREKVFLESAVYLNGADEADSSRESGDTEVRIESATDVLPSTELERLQLKLEEAVASENFEQAAILRDQIQHLKSSS